MSGRKYFCFCEANCKFETMTKEQILAAIAQAAAGGLVFDADAAFIAKVKEQNAGKTMTFWMGTQAQYNAIAKKDSNCYYIITDAPGTSQMLAEVQSIRDAVAQLQYMEAIESTDHPGCYYRIYNGAVEWYNPPMVDGVEYRLTRRHEGKPVYATFVTIGALPASGSMTFGLGNEGDTFDNVIKYHLFAKNNGNGREYPIPMYSTSGALSAYARMGGVRTAYILTFTDLTGYTGKLHMEYTKA